MLQGLLAGIFIAFIGLCVRLVKGMKEEKYQKKNEEAKKRNCWICKACGTENKIGFSCSRCGAEEIKANK